MNYDNISTTQRGFDYSAAGPQYVSINIVEAKELTDEQLIEALAVYWNLPEARCYELRAKLAKDPEADVGDKEHEVCRSMQRRDDLLEEQRRRLGIAA